MALQLLIREMRTAPVSLRVQAPRALITRLHGRAAREHIRPDGAQEWITTYQLLEEARQVITAHHEEEADILAQRLSITRQLGSADVLLFRETQLSANAPTHMSYVAREAAQEHH